MWNFLKKLREVMCNQKMRFGQVATMLVLSLMMGFSFLNFNDGQVFAQNTVLPGTTASTDDCKVVIRDFDQKNNTERRAIFTNTDREEANNIMACGIKTGSIRLWLVPYYIRYVLELLLGLAGLISVLGIVYGGVLYLFSGLSENKDQGKKAIAYGLGGFVLAMSAFAIVNVVIAVVTG